MSTTVRGQAFERLALYYLEQRGLRLVERNYRCRVGELDLIMRDVSSDNQLVFIEVRGRASNRYGGPAASITVHKQQRLLRAAAYYLQKHRVDTACRFDVIAITGNVNEHQIDWIKNAFQS